MENSELNPLEESLRKLVPASLGKRLVNYLVDVIVFSIFLTFLMVALAPVYPLANKIMKHQPVDPIDQLMVTFVYGLYMSVMEALLKGKSIGKFITGTRAVTIAGYPISSNNAFVRGLIRIVPLEMVSIIFSLLMMAGPFPWHDRWSGTLVIDEAQSAFPS